MTNASRAELTALLIAASGTASVLLTGFVRAYALRHDLLDTPNERSSHTHPTPHGGGLGVLAASILGVAAGVALGFIEFHDALTLSVGMAALGIVGWLDDTRGTLAGVRLVVQVAVAFWTLYMFGGLPVIRIGTATFNVGAAGYVLGVLGIVWSINLYNFMDGIDGFAGSQAAIIFGTASLLFLYRGNTSLAAVAAIFAAASLGFLAWNWPPAKIFMGDVGSGAIGYLVCGLAIASENRRSVPLFVFAILGAIFIADSTVTLVRRVKRGNRKIEAHRDHAYQRLARAFGSHRPVTVGAAAAASVLAVLGTIATVSPRLLVPAFIAAIIFVAILLTLTEKKAPM